MFEETASILSQRLLPQNVISGGRNQIISRLQHALSASRSFGNGSSGVVSVSVYYMNMKLFHGQAPAAVELRLSSARILCGLSTPSNAR